MKSLDSMDAPSLCQELVNILRTELQEYGGLLNLLGQQQECILDRDSEGLMQINKEIESQAEANSLIKESRQKVVAYLAGAWEVDPDQRISALAQFFPKPMRPMVVSLTEEVNQLIRKSKQKLDQNRLLLRRLSAITDEILGYMRPDLKPTKTYTNRGAMKSKSASNPGAVELSA